MTTPRTAISYIRFSTPEQQNGDSFRRQYELSKAYAETHGLILDERLTYKDLGVSAFNKSNVRVGQLGKFLDAVESGTVASGSYLLVESLDRISRAQISDALEIFLSILRNGIIIVTLADGMEYSKEKVNNNFTDLIVSIVIMSRAHEESLMKSKRIRAAWGAKRSRIHEQKLTMHAPRWLSLNKDRTAYLLIPERVEIVKLIFAWSKDGIGADTIAKRLNQQSIPVFSTGKARMWYGSYVKKILVGRSVLGEYQPHIRRDGKHIPEGPPILDYYPRVISDSDYALATQARNARRTHGAGRKGRFFSNLFSRTLRCGYCKGSMTYVNKGGSGLRSKFFVCTTAKAGNGCHYIPWEVDCFEKSVLAYCKGLDFTDFLQPRIRIKSEMASLSARVVELEALIGLNEEKYRNILKAIEDGANFSQFQRRAQQLEQEHIQLKFDLNKTKMTYAEQANIKTDVQAIRASIDGLFARMDELEGDDLYDLRATISQHIKRLMSQIYMCPGGYMEKPKYLKKFQEKMIQLGYDKGEIDTCVMNQLKAERNFGERFFIMISRNSSIRVITPESSSPELLRIETSADSMEKGLAEHADTIRTLLQDAVRFNECDVDSSSHENSVGQH